MTLPNLWQYSIFLLINFIFILFILRAVYFVFISKKDPIKVFKPQLRIKTKGFDKWFGKKETKIDLDEMS